MIRLGVPARLSLLRAPTLINPSNSIHLPDEPSPRISVVILSWNEAETLPGLIGSIERQIVQDLEIIFSDSGSADAIVEVAAACRIRPCTAERNGPTEGRNRWAKLAHGEILVFVDADSLLPLEVLEDIPAGLVDPEVIGGAPLFRPHEGTGPERLLFF